MIRNLFLTLALASTVGATAANACNETRSYGTDYISASGNCTGIIGGRVGQCMPMRADGTWWSCQCFTGSCGPSNAAFEVASFQPAAFSCSCHALDRSNPFNESACNALSVGTTCSRVGNLICIPECH